jgi:signal recognition particle subunit SRP54
MVLDNLAESLRSTLRKIANAQHIDKNLIKEVVREIQRALLQADVNVQMVLGLTKEIERRALEEKPPAGRNSRDHVVSIVYEELVKILGETRDVPIKKQRIMLVGLYGQGKTTTCGKLSRYFQKRGLKTALIASDVHRPAAYDQLQQIAAKVKVPIFGNPKEKSAVKIVKEGLEQFKDFDVIIIDTSGRHGLEPDLIQEMKDIAKIAKPEHKLLVMDATVGQQGGPQAKAFHDAVDITGVVITKLDGTAKGGGALSAVGVTKAPVVFIGTGEHLDDLEKFDPNRFISRLLGMGDIKALLERAEGVIDEASAEETARRLLSGKFTLRDMYDQMEALGKMGTLSKLWEMMPWVPKNIDQQRMQGTQDLLKKFRVIMQSMTDEEMDNPSIIKFSRLKRIARGAGVEQHDVKELLKYHKTAKKQIKDMTTDRKKRKMLEKMMSQGNMPMGPQ